MTQNFGDHIQTFKVAQKKKKKLLSVNLDVSSVYDYACECVNFVNF